MHIDQFTREQQEKIYEEEYYNHCNSVSDWWHQDVPEMIVNILAHDLDGKYQCVDVSTYEYGGSSYITSDGVKLSSNKHIQVYYDEEFELCHVRYDLDGLLRKYSVKGGTMQPLMDHVGLTLPEAMIFDLLCDYGPTFAVRGHGALSLRVNDMDADDTDPIVEDLVEYARDNDYTLGNSFSPFFNGVSILEDALKGCEKEFAYLVDSTLNKLYDHFDTLHQHINESLAEEWEYQTSFESWLEHAECNGLEFDPEDYGIEIEETENV